MITTPTLATPNFNEPFIIVTNASNDSISAVLSQHGQAITFLSKALGVAKQSWSIYVKEMLVVIQAIQTWRPYLLGHKFYIQTNQQSLKYLFEQCITTPKQQK